MLEQTKAVYKAWQQLSESFPKPFRFGLGGKIEGVLLEVLELQFLAAFSKPEEKITLVTKSVTRFDLLKFLIQISWEHKHLKDKTYIPISQSLDQIGKELSGWKRYLEQKNSRQG